MARTFCLGVLLLSSSADALRPALPSRRTSALLMASQPSAPAKLPTWPCGDELDRRIASLSLPAVVSFMILPIAQATDLFWVGRMGEALAVAGQAAANQVYSSLAMVTSTIPTILAPKVATANAAGDKEAVQQAVGESIFMSGVICLVLTAAIWGVQQPALLALGNPNALPFSVPYLRSRLPGIVLEGTSVVGFAAFRGMMDTLTPLKVSSSWSKVNVPPAPVPGRHPMRAPGGSKGSSRTHRAPAEPLGGLPWPQQPAATTAATHAATTAATAAAGLSDQQPDQRVSRPAAHLHRGDGHRRRRRRHRRVAALLCCGVPDTAAPYAHLGAQTTDWQLASSSAHDTCTHARARAPAPAQAARWSRSARSSGCRRASRSWLKVSSTLFEDAAPSSRLVAPRAQAALLRTPERSLRHLELAVVSASHLRPPPK